jgi:hypothetical protein
MDQVAGDYSGYWHTPASIARNTACEVKGAFFACIPNLSGSHETGHEGRILQDTVEELSAGILTKQQRFAMPDHPRRMAARKRITRKKDQETETT